MSNINVITGTLKTVKGTQTKNGKDATIVELLIKRWDRDAAKEVEEAKSIFYFGKAAEDAKKKTSLVGRPVMVTVEVVDGKEFGSLPPKALAFVELPAYEKENATVADKKAFSKALDVLKRLEILPEEYEGTPVETLELIKQGYSIGDRPDEVKDFLKAAYKVVATKTYHYLGTVAKKFENQNDVSVSVKLPAKPDEDGEWVALRFTGEKGLKTSKAIREGDVVHFILGDKYVSLKGNTSFRVLNFKVLSKKSGTAVSA